MNDQRPSLVEELRQGLVKRVTLAVIAIVIIAAGLHLLWSYEVRSGTEARLRQAVARNLEEAVRVHDLISLRRTLQAFWDSNDQASICVRLHNGILLEQPNCSQPEFEEFRVPLTDEEFAVSVKLPLLNSMALAGLPFILSAAILLLLISNYLRRFSGRIVSDVNMLVPCNEDEPEFSELHRVKLRIKENVQLKASALLGEIALQVAHDIRSPLSALNMVAGASRSLSAEERALVSKSVARISQISSDLLTQYKRNKINSVAVDVLLKETVEEMRPILGRRALSIEASPGDNLLAQIGDEVSLRRIFTNLLSNAVEATDDSGRIEVCMRHSSDFLQVTIGDNGVGIPKSELSKVGTKGFSLKPNGTGLGVSSAIDQLNDWGGLLDIKSESGEGTAVTVWLRRSKLPAHR